MIAAKKATVWRFEGKELELELDPGGDDPSDTPGIWIMARDGRDDEVLFLLDADTAREIAGHLLGLADAVAGTTSVGSKAS